jgi:hypothetical protein
LWDANLVLGLVALSGLVVEHVRGFRANQARIVTLFATSIRCELASRFPDIEVQPLAVKKWKKE